jgi:hypothetical protein
MKRTIRALCAYALVVVPSVAAMAQVPGEVSQISPSDAVTGLPVMPTFKWFTEPLSDNYRVIISTSASAGNAVTSPAAADTIHTLAISLDNGREYYWNVRGNNGDGDGPLTTWRSFVTVPGGATQVTLTSPSNGATDVAIDPTLTWVGVGGATTYHLQVSTSSDFGTTVVDNASVGTTQFTPALNNSQTYYWRVKASNAAEHNWSSTWSLTTVAAPAPGPVTQISPTAASTDLSVMPTFKWFTESLSDDYTLIVSTSASEGDAIVSTVIADTFHTLVSALDNGREYYWNVRGKNANGTGPLATWRSFITISGGAMQVALTSPGNGATEVAIDQTLTWGSVGGASSYHLQVSTSSDFGTTVVDNPSVGTTQFTPALDVNETYYWRVKASNAGTYNWSETWSFSTITVDPPVAPALISPPNGATGVTTGPLFAWNSATGADSYRIDVSTDPGFGTTVISETGAGTTYQAGGLLGGQAYFWRVEALNAGGGATSSIWSFTTDAGAVPGAVSLISPLDAATDLTVMPSFKWSSESLSDDYTLFVSTSASTGDAVVTQAVADTFHTLASPLENGRQYYWNVRGNNSNGAGALSTWRSFITVTGGAKQVVLTNPGNGATDVALEPYLKWNAVTGATTYRLQVSTSANFGTTVIDDASIAIAEYQATLNHTQTYYWRVRASNAAEHNWSETWSFTTLTLSIPGVVALKAPGNGGTGISINLNLTWFSEPASDLYDFQLSTSNEFSSPLVDESGLADTTLSAPELMYGTPYLWRVRGTNAAGAGAWSQAWSFTTISGGPQKVVLTDPSNGGVDADIAPLFKWSSVSGAASYALQVSKQSNFSSTVINRDAVVGTQFQAAALESFTKYYWRVRASNAGLGNWSDTWSFTTIVGTPDKVTLLLPADKTQNVTVNTVLVWNQAQKAKTYQVQMTEKEDDFTETSYEANGITGTSHQVPELIHGDVYWWRVRAVNDAGDGEWSEPWGYLTARGGDQQPLIVSPLPGETGVSLEPLLVWSSVPESAASKLGVAVTYHVQVATNFSFSGGSIVMEETMNPDTTFQAFGLLADTTYTWRVRASNAGPLNWTMTSSFVTGKGVPTQVVLESPVNGSVDIPLETNLIWTVPLRATSFNLQVSLDPAFTTVVISESGLTNVVHVVKNLDPMADYYWRVQAVNQDGIGDWSDVWAFSTVALSAPLAPVLISPLNGATEVSHRPLLTWNASATASSYKLEISTSPEFSTVSLVVVVTQPFYQAEALQVGQTYYWRVEARNAGGSSISDAWGFTTVLTTDTETDELPGVFALGQNYPNPFNPSTTLEFSMPVAAHALLVVYNIRGEEVTTLVDGSVPAGNHSVVWNAVDMPSGVYLYRFQAGDFVSTKKLTLAK